MGTTAGGVLLLLNVPPLDRLKYSEAGIQLPTTSHGRDFEERAGGLAKGTPAAAPWHPPRVKRGGLPHLLRLCTGWLLMAAPAKYFL